MKKALGIIFLCFPIWNSIAQFGPQIIISTEANAPRIAHPADIDGDGDLDLLSASQADDKIAWYENVDGLGTFGPQNSITTTLDNTSTVFTADLDGDGDLDVLGNSGPDDKVVWFENLDGQGSFGTERLITNLADGAISIFTGDLDGDGDMDVLSASFMDSKVAWYENIDGEGNFGPQQIITQFASSTRNVSAADLDGDGDLDVIATSTGTDEILWFENTDGLGNFSTARVVYNDVNGSNAMFVIDLDGDGDIDILATSQADDKIVWFENTDGGGNFGTERFITTESQTPWYVHAADLDNDGDLDVLSACPGNDVITWYENLDGLENFGPQQVITYDIIGARSAIAADFDNDGDMDVVSASIGDSKIAWYENLTILGQSDTIKQEFKLYPNPAGEIVFIQSQNGKVLNGIKIRDVFGKILLQQEGQANEIKVSELPSGLYFVQLETSQGISILKIVKE